jgi:HTH-type transcriptional regulator/antitoxin HigA
MKVETLPYKVIKTETQYFKYCDKLEELTDSGSKSKTVQDEIELLTLLIEKYDEEHNTFDEADPIEILKSLMKEHKMKSVHLADLLGVSEGLVSDMLKYKKGLSKETIRILSERFKLNQQAFNRPYKLKTSVNSHLRNASVMNTEKKLKTA